MTASRKLSAFIALLCAVFVSPVFAREAIPVKCRDALHPLLLQANPDRNLLLDVQLICQKQAADGDPDALYQLSLLFLGLIDWQPDKAVPMIRSAAADGIPEAQYWLAWQYESGPLLENDAQLALHWYQRAAGQEHRLALKRLADVYENGELGEVVDWKKAELYRALAARCRNQPQSSG